ncbi:MAG: hypothetical protein II621_05215 [Clostridia bacterium]|jgi:hypothetical protein|nr:hypothetical protein [Clostridia bacterium]
MRRKIIAVVLVLSLAVLFAACTGNDNKPSLPSFSFDPGTSFSGADSSTDPSGSDVSVSAQTGEGNTVILTTTPGQTMQTVPTTRFVPEPVTTTQPSTVDPNVSLTVPTMTTPSVITSNNSGGVTYVTVSPTLPTYTTRYNPYLTTQPTVNPYLTTTRYNPTTQPTSVTIPTVTQSTTKPTTTQPTTSATRRAKTVVINDIATTSDKKMVVTIDSNGWDGSFQNNSQTISIKVDGVAKSAPCSVRSGAKNADGYQYITIDLSELSVPEGSNVQFTVPAAFLQTSSGAQYNNAFSGAYTMM